MMKYLVVHFFEYFELLDFKKRIHGQIRRIPVGHNSPSAKGTFLHFDCLKSKLTSPLSYLCRRESFLCTLVLRIQGLQLDWQAMAVPAWNMAYLETLHHFVAADDVLENFI